MFTRKDETWQQWNVDRDLRRPCSSRVRKNGRGIVGRRGEKQDSAPTIAPCRCGKDDFICPILAKSPFHCAQTSNTVPPLFWAGYPRIFEIGAPIKAS
ncbi:hypothetical protein E2C01_017581 [Portunus trituberculatus]|uniref:Uncharacterized protein n=1 Tax=Portunus trituberculatus TaxID=210409 RepID=A0A5B7DTW1_PORTR|nr:hypothetical protein [Portunus trituberculatus]